MLVMDVQREVVLKTCVSPDQTPHLWFLWLKIQMLITMQNSPVEDNIHILFIVQHSWCSQIPLQLIPANKF